MKTQKQHIVLNNYRIAGDFPSQLDNNMVFLNQI